jgi:hypothetical protein
MWFLYSKRRPYWYLQQLHMKSVLPDLDLYWNALICAWALRVAYLHWMSCRLHGLQWGVPVGCLICWTLCLPSPGLWKFGQAGCLQADSSDWRHLCELPRKINQFPKAAKTSSLQRELKPLFQYQEQMEAIVSYVTYNWRFFSVRKIYIFWRMVLLGCYTVWLL